MIQILLDNEYRQTTMIAAPGDFKLEEDTIVLLRRAFPYPDNQSHNVYYVWRFTDNKLSRIEDLVNVKADWWIPSCA